MQASQKFVRVQERDNVQCHRRKIRVIRVQAGTEKEVPKRVQHAQIGIWGTETTQRP